MKRKKTAALFVTAAILAGIMAVWYFTPKQFLGRVEASAIWSILVFDGNTGTEFVIDDSEEIKRIVENIQGMDMKRDGLCVGYSGYGLKMEFQGEDGKRVDGFMINSPDMIREEPFFYRCNGGLCFDYLKELEGRSVN
ncbi:MAG: hypothetical protein NC307_07175 [Roseburia sp.]|nr:hypothetical protein [Roseburia sp.]